MQSATNAITAVHRFGAHCLKPMKRFFLGRGSMMALFERIKAAQSIGNKNEIRRVRSLLCNTIPEIWSPRYSKYHQLILLCDYCLANTSARRSAVYHDLVPLLHDDAHELTGRIMELIHSSDK